MTQVTRRDFNRLAATATVAGASTLGAPALVRAQTNKLKVGVLLPRSGSQAFIGQSCQLGIDISPGLLQEMYGVEVELMNADTETNVEVARARAEKLINDGAQILVGPFDSGAASAIAQVAEQRKIPFVINIAAAPQITEQGYKYTFRNFPTAIDLVRNGLSLFRDVFQVTQTAPRTAVFMHVNDTFGTQIDPQSVLDLYCGVGGFALNAALAPGRADRQVEGIEVSPDAVVMPCSGGGLSAGITEAVLDAHPGTLSVVVERSEPIDAGDRRFLLPRLDLCDQVIRRDARRQRKCRCAGLLELLHERSADTALIEHDDHPGAVEIDAGRDAMADGWPQARYGNATRKSVDGVEVTVYDVGCLGNRFRRGRLACNRGPEVGAVAYPVGDVSQCGEVAQLQVVVAFHRVAGSYRCEHFGLLDGVDAEVGFEIEVRFQQL